MAVGEGAVQDLPAGEELGLGHLHALVHMHFTLLQAAAAVPYHLEPGQQERPTEKLIKDAQRQLNQLVDDVVTFACSCIIIIPVCRT